MVGWLQLAPVNYVPSLELSNPGKRTGVMLWFLASLMHPPNVSISDMLLLENP